jgi:urease accessory protein
MTTLRPDLDTARRTRIRVDAVAGGRLAVATEITGGPARPALRPMLLSSAPGHARICLVPDGALLLAGDAIALDLEVGDGVRLDVVEPGGTVAYDMRGGEARWDVRLALGARSSLTWAGEPFVLASGSRVIRSTRIRVGPGARLALRETLVLGRHGERAGLLEQHLRAYDEHDAELLVEDLVLDRSTHRPGILGGHRVLGSVVALGLAIPAGVCPEGRLDLDEGGTVWRRLAGDAHRADLSGAWDAALAAC